MNVNLLKGKMVENGLNIARLADEIDLSRATLYRKLNEGGEKLTVGEMQMIADRLSLDHSEICKIFFS